VGSGAQVLGPVTVGEGARVGANAVVAKDVPARATMVGIPAKQVPLREPAPSGEAGEQRFAAYGTPTGDIPDPIARALEGLSQEVHHLRARLAELEDGAPESARGELGGLRDEPAATPGRRASDDTTTGQC
jgi:serine O-acetyltransferase